jgi:hypothetical protein
MDIFQQQQRAARELKKATRELKLVQAEATPKPRFNFGRWADRSLLEIAVHIPVAVAIGISWYGWEQYGAFAYGLVPLTFAISFLLSRAYSMCIRTHRYDVAAWLFLLGGLAFAWEAYGVHLGLERFNHHNAAAELQTFAPWILILASIMLGLMNVASRRAFVTGHDDPTEQMGGPEQWWRWDARRKKGFETIARAERRDAFARGIGGLNDEEALAIYRKHDAWPLGFTPSAELAARVAA